MCRWLLVVVIVAGLAGLASDAFSQRVVRERKPTPKQLREAAEKAATEKALRNALEEEERIKRAKEDRRIRELEAAYLRRSEEWEVGQKGKIDSRETFTITQVVDEHNVIVERAYFERNNPTRGKIYEPIWVKIDTEGMADGRPWNRGLDVVFKVAGTKTYESVGGTKTILALEPEDAGGAITPKRREARDLSPPRNTSQPWEVGDAGRLWHKEDKEELSILQIVDENNVLMQRKCFGGLPGSKYREGWDYETIWVKIDTNGMVDGRPWRYDPKMVVKVTGTKRYETAGGGPKTVIVLEPVIDEKK